jgi:hypothetical protein
MLGNWFMFHFVYGEDEKSLEMVECGYMKMTNPPGGSLPPGA